MAACGGAASTVSANVIRTLAPLPPIDWARPWLFPFSAAATGIDTGSPGWAGQMTQSAAHHALANARGQPLHFVPQECLPAGEAYETFIDRSGCVPTRHNLHDYFNALVWSTYPAAKRALNAIQANVLAEKSGSAAGEGGRRGKLRDRATIFDENAALLLCADPMFETALRAHDWQACFLGRSCGKPAYEVRLFGHALLEKLVTPYKAITAHVWVLPVEKSFLTATEAERRAGLDELLCAGLERGMLSQPSTPLPVLGVPGWWPQQDAAFYADDTIFRQKRARQKSAPG